MQKHLALTLDQSNCRPRVLHRSFRSKKEAGSDLHVFPPDDMEDSSINFHLGLVEHESGPDAKFVAEVSSLSKFLAEVSSSIKTLLSFAAVNKLCIGP